ncbi:hypothetical protein [Streptomyces sp. NPDC059564]|uniref:hypothetical protein n=1 Tax=Streptomyces sp. NPDC059564 TaxID=3346865 RepID=UPI0036A5F4F4
MATTVVGFRLGSDKRGRQVTLLLTGAGVLHRGNGLYGMTPQLSKPAVPVAGVDPHPVPRQAARLREVHAQLIKDGYTRVLIAPACIQLKEDEHPLHPQPYGENAPPRHPELLSEFVGRAPASCGQLEDAIRSFYTTIGLPVRPAHSIPRARSISPMSPRVEAALHTLAHNQILTSPRARAVGWRVTHDSVRLHVGSAGDNLSHAEVLDLQAALTAWLRLHPRGSAG